MNSNNKIITSDINNSKNIKNISENFDDQNSKQYNLYNFFKKNAIKSDIFLDFLQDPLFSIVLQKSLMGAKAEYIHDLLLTLKGNFRSLINDKNGNYFCSDLFMVCEQKQRIQILKEISPYLSNDCTNNFATHPIQVLIEKASSDEEYKLILNSFKDYELFLYAALSPNGAYTLQKIIERIPEEYRKEFNDIIINFIGFISKEKFGIVVVKKFISYTNDQNITYSILNSVKKKFVDFSSDQYANYLIQFLLDKWRDTKEGNEIKELVKKNFLMMCEKKYSSFICEKFITIITPEEKRDLIKQINVEAINKSINPHFIKIMKALGIYKNQDSNNHSNDN